ncbi:hypothetical protein F5878DRAFT_647916 [Lentinula raphanica]|uniref:Uncharacterized protein n=1 Tax=Lentinula raphanica TaxID=153919 RepID=A0AA38NV46_9AGAR|nr:hypothetical protein F5878DRAFT_647916 [Lentinula raphanica]
MSGLVLTMSAVNATPKNATPKVNSPRRRSRKRPRGKPVGSRKSKRIRREDENQEEQIYVPGSWVLEQVSTGETDEVGDDKSNVEEELIRLFVVDRSGYVESPIPSVSLKTILAQRPLPQEFVIIRNSNTRFIRNLHNRADTTISEDEVSAILTEHDSSTSECTTIDLPGTRMKRSKGEVNAIVTERDSSTSECPTIDSPGTTFNRSSQPHHQWSFAALQREATGTSELASPFLSFACIRPYCALPDGEMFDEDVIENFDLKEANGDQEDSDLDWMDMELVYPGADFTESA